MMGDVEWFANNLEQPPVPIIFILEVASPTWVADRATATSVGLDKLARVIPGTNSAGV